MLLAWIPREVAILRYHCIAVSIFGSYSFSVLFLHWNTNRIWLLYRIQHQCRSYQVFVCCVVYDIVYNDTHTFVCLCLPFCVLLYSVDSFACCFVLGLVFFQYQAKRLAGTNVSEMTYFVPSGTQNLNQSSLTVILELFFALIGLLGPRWDLKSGKFVFCCNFR